MANYELIAPCGLYCGACPLYKAASDPALAQKIAQRQNIPLEAASCAGCRPLQGHIKIMGEPGCGTYDCAINQRGVDFCYNCPDFPCLKLAPCSDRAQELPHNTKIYNLILLSKMDPEQWVAEAEARLRNYFRGKKPRAGDEIQI